MTRTLTARALVLFLVIAGAAVPTGAAEPAAKDFTPAGIRGGLAVILGCGDPELPARLHGQGGFTVIVLDTDDARIATARQYLADRGLYGPVTAMKFDGTRLPLAGNMVNLIVQLSGFSVPDEEKMRVLVPGGAWAPYDGGHRTPDTEHLATKPRDSRLDGWSHVFHDASNNACSHDKVVGPPKSLRWWAGPCSERSHNWVNGTAAMVSAGGRLFYLHDQGPISTMPHKGADMNWAIRPVEAPEFPEQWALVARDAHNGVLLWKRPLAGFGNLEFEAIGPSQPTTWNCWSSPLSLNRRMVAVDDRVYVTLSYRGGLSALDAATGRTVWEYEPKGNVDEIVCDGDRVYVRVRAEIPRKRDVPFSTKAMDKGWGKTYGPEAYTKYVEGQPPNTVAVLDAATGQELWKTETRYVATESLCVLNGRLCWFDYEDIICTDARTGNELWRQPTEKVLGRGKTYVRGGMAGMLLLWENKAYFVGAGTTCFSLEDGKELWTNPRTRFGWGFGHPTGLRIVNGIIYDDNTNMTDARTGESLGTAVVNRALGSSHGRCHRGVATERFLLGIQFGVEFHDLEKKEMVADCRWLRSSCALGYLPANGLLYHAPDPCACWIGARIRGYHALGPDPPELDYDTVVPEERLEKGPAYSSRPTNHNPRSRINDQSWPTYRHDALRSGQASTRVSTDLEIAWNADLKSVAKAPGYSFTAGLTPPVVAGGRVLVSRKDANEIVCMDADDGETIWRCQTPCMVDSPPTIVDGRVLFGCTDGYLYCLRSSDGTLAWRFRLAPADMLVIQESRPASKWPSHGAVLIKDSAVYCTSGYSSFLDRGIHVYKLDLCTGKLLAHTRLEGPDYPFTEQNPFYEGKKDDRGNPIVRPKGYFLTDLEGARSDILVSDGVDLRMGQTRITTDLRTSSVLVEDAAGTTTGRRWLRPMNGFLDDTYFHRVGWHYSDKYYGYGNTAAAANAGKILSFDDTFCYSAQWQGSGRGRYPNHLIGEGTLICADTVETENKQKGFDVTRVERPVWQAKTPLIVRAMLLAPDSDGGKTVFVAGPVEPKAGQSTLDPYENRGKGRLIALSAANGKKLLELELPAVPVFDGMAAADGGLFISLCNGEVISLKAKE